MGAKGGASPQPYKQYESKTTFLRVPLVDWAAVSTGIKREFRGGSGRDVTQLWNVKPPTPVVAYTVYPGPRHDAKLMVLTKTWREPLGAISDESLAAEGFIDIAHFRRYWMARTKRRFTPLMQVQVYRVRPWAEGDDEILGAALVRRLYRDHLYG